MSRIPKLTFQAALGILALCRASPTQVSTLLQDCRGIIAILQAFVVW